MEKKADLIFTSFYTRNTGYEEEIKNLIECYKKFNLPYIIEAVGNTYHWQRNTKLKAQIIKKQLCENPGKAVVYLDADSIIHQYPSLFFEIKEDVGANIRMFDRAIGQLNGAVLFFNNTPQARGVVDEWIKRNNADLERWDQDILKEILDERKDVSFRHLPLEYCKIFDTDAKRVSNPVIEQYQASRKYKDLVVCPQDEKLETQEREKYQQGWTRGIETSSQTSRFIANYLVGRINKEWEILEIGCGAGNATMDLRRLGYKATGVDITLAVVKETLGFFEAPLWRLPFEDNSFDFSFSTDVMEHIPPELVGKCIREIYRVTKHETYHVIMPLPHKKEGFVFHLTVQPIEWWRDMFYIMKSRAEKNIRTTIVEREDVIRHTDEVAFIIGGGVSVENLDLKKLIGQYVIGVNRAFEIYPNPAEIFFGDSSFFEEFGEKVMAISVPKITVVKSLKNRSAIDVWDKTGNTEELQTAPRKLIKSNSGVMAVNYALTTGAKLIVLIGMDLKETNGRKHHHAGYTHPSKPKTCDQMLEEFKGIRCQAWKKFGADLIHAAPGSALTEVEYLPLEETISAIKTKDYFGGWWLPKGEDHFRMMLKKSNEVAGRLSYQYYKLKPALEYVKDFTGVVVDIGSNVGFWAWHLAAKFPLVHCFEPISIHNECMRLNTRNLDNIKIYEESLSDKEGELCFKVYPGDCGKTHVSEDGFKAKCRTLDSYNLKHVSFLKVDCEGWELPVLQGAEKTLLESKPVIVVEQKRENERHNLPSKGAVEYLISLGYVVREELVGDYIMTFGE